MVLGAQIVLFVLSLISMKCLLSLIQKRREFVRTASRASGLVVTIEESPDSNTDYASFAPRVRFTTTSGEERAFTAQIFTSWMFHKTGDTVEVIYDVNNPNHVLVNSFVQLYSMYIVGLILSVLVLCIAVGVLST